MNLVVPPPIFRLIASIIGVYAAGPGCDIHWNCASLMRYLPEALLILPFGILGEGVIVLYWVHDGMCLCLLMIKSVYSSRGRNIYFSS